MRTLLFLTVALVALVARPLNAATALIPTDRTNANWRYVYRPPTHAEIRARTVFQEYTTASPPSVAALNTVINNCPSNQIVLFKVGTYNFAGRVVIPKSGVYLVAETNELVWFTNTGSGDNSQLFMGSGSHDQLLSTSTAYGISTAVPSTLLIGSTNITMSTTPTEWAVGDIIQLDQLEDDAASLVDASGNSGHCNWCSRATGTRSFNIIVEITALAGSDVTFWPPLDMDINASQTPQGIEHKGIIRLSGMAGIILTNIANVTDTTVMEGTWNCAYVDCKLLHSFRRHVWIYGGGQQSFIGTDFRYGGFSSNDWSLAYTSDRAYGILFALQNSRGLVENCIFEKLSYAVAWEGGGRGAVLGYNFCTNIQNNSEISAKPFTGNHGAHPSKVLVEGNWTAARISMDHYWGSSSHWMYLRNRIKGVYTQNGTPVTQYCVLFDVWTNNVYHTFVGNIVGDAGVENRLHVGSGESVNEGSAVKAIFRFGNLDANHTTWSQYHQPASNTAHVAVNHLSRTNTSVSGAGILYHGDVDNTDTNIPASLYLTAKPSSQGFLRWPPYDAFESSQDSPTNIAAGYRFYFGTNPPAGAGGGGAPEPDLNFTRGKPRLRSTIRL